METTPQPSDGLPLSRPHACHMEQLVSLRRIEGQIRGIGRMIEEGKYCVDIISQVRAARSALASVEAKILAKHVESCVKHAVRSGTDEAAQDKLDEVIQYVIKSIR